MKKLLLTLAVMTLFVCVFTITAFAASQSYASFEVTLKDGSKIPVYTVGISDLGNGKINLSETAYTEKPTDSEGTYAALDWSTVKEIDFTNTTLYYYNKNAYTEYTGGTNGNAKGRVSVQKSWSNASTFASVKKITTGNAWSFGPNLFAGWTGLETAVISNKVDTLSDNMFKDSAVANVIFEEGSQVYRCNNNLFQNCDNLVSVEFPDSFTYLGNSGLFYDCDNLESVVWSKNCPAIPGSAFYGCEKFSFEIPDYITEIKSSAFNGCKAITSVVIPASVTSIGSDCWRGCSNLTSVVFEEGCSVTSIYAHTFDGCRFSEITLPNTVTQLKQSAFASNPNLKVINLGAAFVDCNLEGNKSASLNSGSALEVLYLSKNFTAASVRADIFGDDDNSGQWPKIFPNLVIYYTGDKNAAEAIVAAAQGTGGAVVNGVLANMTLVTEEEYLALKAADQLSGRYMIYGYNGCDAFYNGKHTEGVVLNSCQFGCGRNCGKVELLDNPQHELNRVEELGEGGYFGTICVTESCTVCSTVTIDENIAPIFTWKGYSACTFGEGYSVVQGFYVNKSSVDAYLVYAPDFNYGILATVNATDGAIAPKLGDENVIIGNFDKGANDYLDIKVTGIPEGYEGTKVVFCVYVTVGEKMYYLDNNTTGETITGISYSEVVALNNN